MATPLSLGADPSVDEVVPLLLVDDEPVNLAGIEMMLAPGRYRYVHAHTPDEALLHLLNQDFAAIVLDVRLPGMTGIELARLIKGRRRTEHVPILFLTAHLLDETDVLRGYGTGAVDYLTKPVSPAILRSKIAVFADLYRKSRALEATNEALHKQIVQREIAEETLRRVNQELERRVAERTAALRAADQRKDEFLAALAHELRNPLAALQGAAEVIRLTAPPTRELQSSQSVISRQLVQMERLVDDLLDVSRITRGRLLLKRSRVELTSVMEEALDIGRSIVDRHGHTLTVDLPTEPAFLDADPVRLCQIIGNLLDNAAKYTKPGGRVNLVVTANSRDVEIRVDDTGIGIDADTLPTIFDLFVQAETTDASPRSGLGIGLTLVKQLVELHGGSIEATSPGAGQGSCFKVRLPRSDSRPAAPSQSQTDERPSRERSLRVLIVEDNRDAADMLQLLVRSWGHVVRTVGDGMAALDLANAFRPQVVILDIGLPNLDGHAVAKRLRAQPWCANTLIVAITGRGQDVDRLRSEEAGIDRHFLKPVDLKVLRGLMAEASARMVAESSAPARA